MRHPDQACYIHCNHDCSAWAKNHVYKEKEDDKTNSKSKKNPGKKSATKAKKAKTTK